VNEVSVDVPGGDLGEIAGDVVGNLNTHGVSPGIFCSFEGEGSTDVSSFDDADGSKSGSHRGSHIGRLGVAETVVKRVLSVSRCATASKVSGAGVGTETDWTGGASVSSVLAAINGTASITITIVTWSALATCTERRVGDTQGITVARVVFVTLLVRTFGSSVTSTLKANNKTLGRRSSVISSGVRSTTPGKRGTR